MKPRSLAYLVSILAFLPILSESAGWQLGVVNPLPPASSDWTYKLDTGPHEVAMMPRIRLYDPVRDRTIPVSLVHPKERGPFPLIIYSHGSGATGQYDYPIARFWASHGYVVLQPTHADTRSLAIPEEELSQLSGPDLWISRSRDVVFVLDSLEALEDFPGLAGKLDHEAVGMSGHSLGAYTAQMVGGVRLQLSDGGELQSFGDPRPLAFLLLSGQGRGDQGLVDGSWDEFRRPMMAMTGSRDPGPRGRRPEWRAEPFELSPAGDKFQAFIDGATHYSYPGLYDEGRTDPRIQAELLIFDYVRTATIAFWDAYLKDDSAARAFLASGLLAENSERRVRLSAR